VIRPALAAALVLVGCAEAPPESAPTPAAADSSPLAPCEDAPAPGLAPVALAPGWQQVPLPGDPNDYLDGIRRSNAGAVVVADLDGDGWDDAFLGGVTTDSQLAWGGPDGFGTPVPFPLPQLPTGVTAASVADLEGDGDLDLLVSGFSATAVLRNPGGGGRSLSVEPDAIEPQAGSITSHAWGDVDGDGDLDLFLAAQAEVEWDDVATAETGVDRLWLWEDGWVLADEQPGHAGDGAALFATMRDLDGDGRLEILVLNDFGNAVSSKLWRWDDGWTDVWSDVGLPLIVAPMGVDVRDVDGDGWDDLWITDRATNHLVRGGAKFTDATLTWGANLPHEDDHVSGSAVPLDLEADGVPEELVVYGDLWDPGTVDLAPQPDLLWRLADEELVFRDASLYLDSPVVHGRGAARGDFDGDGSPDVVVGSIEGPPVALRSRCVAGGRLVVQLDDAARHNRFGVGARLELQLPDRTLVDHVPGGGPGTFSGEGPVVRFAFGDESPEGLTVRWPDGGVSEVELPCVDCRLVVRR